MKYSKEFKLECVMKHKNGEHIKDAPGTNHKHFHNQVLKWNRMYDSLGEVGLQHVTSPLPIELRIELIKRVEAGNPYTSVAHSSGIGLIY